MTTTICPVCGTPCEGGHHAGDNTVFICPRCGGYRLASTVIQEFENGSRRTPDPDWFRELVREKRGDSPDYPTITSYDLDG